MYLSVHTIMYIERGRDVSQIEASVLQYFVFTERAINFAFFLCSFFMIFHKYCSEPLEKNRIK